MIPRHLAVGIVASLAMHVVLAAGIALLPPRIPPAAGAPDLVALRVLDARPGPAAATTGTVAVTAVAPEAPVRPAPPRAAKTPTRPPVAPHPAPPEPATPPPAPQPVANDEPPMPEDPVRTAPPGDVGAGADGGPANPADGAVGGTGDGASAGARESTTGADASAGGDAGTGGPRAGSDGEPVLAQRRRAYALDVRRSLESVGRYPATARRLGLAGEVVLRVRIDEAGRVADTSVDAPSRHPELDRAALASARRLDALSPPPGGAIDVVVPVVFTMRLR